MTTVVINAGTITVDSTVYTSAACANMLAHFGVTQLTIDNAVVTPDAEGDDDTNPNLSITGNTDIFSIALTNVELYLDFSVTPMHFQFSGTFPTLQLSTLEMQNVFPVDGLAHLGELLNISFPDMNLIFDSINDTLYFGAVESTAQITALSSNGFALTKVGFEFIQIFAESQATFVLYAVITLGQTEIDTQIQIPLGGPLAANNWILSINTTLQLSSGLADLVSFLDGTKLGQQLGIASFHALFPDDLHQFPTIFLDVLEIQFNPFTPTFSSILLQFSSVHPLQIGDNLFAVEQAGARLYIDLTNNTVLTTLSGSIQIKEEASINVAITLPANLKQDNWIFTLDLVFYLDGLADISGLPINTPLGDLSLPDALLTITDLRINTFEVDFNPLNQTVSSIQVEVALYASCQIGELLVSNPTFALNITNPFDNSTLPTRELDGAIAGTIGVDTLNFDLSASKQGSSWSFTGQSEPGVIQIGDFLTALGNQFHIQLPDFVSSIELDSIVLKFNSQGNDASGATAYDDTVFTCSGKLSIQSTELDIVLTIEVKNAGTSYTRTLGGTLTIGSRIFTLLFNENNTSNYLIASYVNKGGETFNIHDELASYLPSAISDVIPEGLVIDFKDLLLVYSKQTIESGDIQTTFLFGLDIGVNLPSLSNLPLVGQELPTSQSISFDDLQMIVASQDLPQATTSAIGLLLPDGTRLPGTDINAGLMLTASLNIGGTPQTISAQVTGAQTPAPTTLTVTPAANQTSAQNAQWYSLQKSFGPVYFDKIGVKYQDGAIWILLDAALSAAGLTISLEGLALGSPLNKFDPQFSLSGLGIDFQEGPVAIDGAFLPITTGKVTEYNGAAVLKTEELTLGALGSYATLDGHPSMFLYAVLDYPLGGPPFFYVTGLVAGFGYNRALIVPSVDQVAQFPLVTAAVNGVTPPKNPTDVLNQLANLDQYLNPDVGANFLAVGLKFTSFKIIDSFALLTVLFGNQFELDVLGLSTLVHPPHVDGEPSVPALAVVQMELKASFIPSQGFLGVSAQLTSASYLLSPNCHLTGGFAFYSWFSGTHAGDFVQTLGGYHPAFVVPDYYPKVPRLGFNWQIDSNISIKGDAYYALTASMLMAGLQMQATWKSGDLSAWFNTDVDFLIAWKPYHYDAQAHADMGVGYTFHLFGTHHMTFDIGANLHIWGPDFSGTAHIKLSVVSFDISFGSQPTRQPDPLKWPAFKQSFLPADSTVCSMSVSDGLVSQSAQDGDLGVVNPKSFTLVVSSVVPASHAHIVNDLSLQQLFYTPSEAQENSYIPFMVNSAGSLVQTPPTDAKVLTPGVPAIAPMNVSANNFSSTYTITITNNDDHVETSFAYTPIVKNQPMGLWGQATQSDPNAPRFVENTLAGFAISPAVSPAAGVSIQIDRARLLTDQVVVPDAYAWSTNVPFQAQNLTDAARRQTISSTIASSTVNTTRQQICAALDMTADIELNQAIATTMADEFLVAPQIEQ